MSVHIVSQGECLSSIASANGLRWPDIWNHPNNAELKRRRKDPNVLFPGDELFVPEKVIKTEAKATESTHKFVKPGAQAFLRLKLLEWDKALAKQKYLLEFESVSVAGETDEHGYLEELIPLSLTTARLYSGSDRAPIDLFIGGLDPITEVTGLQGRLVNLGYSCPVDGATSERTIEATSLFQMDAGLSVTGTFDPATETAILSSHGR